METDTGTETDIANRLPKAQDLRTKIAMMEAEKASEVMRRHSQEETEKKALLEQLSKPWGVSDEEAIRRACAIIDRAVNNGLNEVRVFRFPSRLCTDHGRAINQQEVRVGTNADRNPARNLRPLAKAFSDAGVQAAGGDYRVSRGNAGRRGDDPRVVRQRAAGG